MKYVLRLLFLGWLSFSVFLLIVPPSGRWGSWAYSFMKIFGENQHEIQFAAHFVLMGGCAVLLQFNFRIHSRWKAFVLALGLTMLFAVTMEMVQGFLPYRFQRQSDPLDLFPGLVGALIGCVLGLILPRCKE
jgi:VanZ family protein